MNERILNLARIAQGNNPADYAPDDDVILLATQDVEKFAELIVKECASICDKIYFERYPDAEDFERSEEGDAIKEHFGIEE